MHALRATIVADTRFGRQAWDRNIFGHFIEHFHRQVYGGLFDPGSPLADERGFRQDVIAALRELRMPVMRWPGGNFVSDYHWHEAVGPNRIASYNKAWRVPEPNTFGTDEFIAWCREVGCEPYICTNGGNGTAEEMSNWVEYCNGTYATRHAEQRRANGADAPHAVRYWGIGNESYGDWQIGAKTIAEWGPYVAESAKMMRAVDDTILLSAAAVPDTDWTHALLKHAGRYLDLISIHDYWDPLWQDDKPSDYLTAMMQCDGPDKAIAASRAVIASAGFSGRIRVAFDEWNLRGWHHPAGNGPDAIAARDRNDIDATYTMADALFSAAFFNACLRNADLVAMANVSPIVNARGPLHVHPGGIVRRTSFHTMKLYVDHTRAAVVKAATHAPRLSAGGKDVAVLDALVSADAAGTTIALTNRHPDQPASVAITLDGVPVAKDLAATVLDGASPDAFNSIDHPNAVTPRHAVLTCTDGAYEIPPHALCMLTIPA